MPAFVTIVLDGVGIGSQPDAHRYGDDGSNTLAHVCAVARPSLSNLASLGLGCIRQLDGVPSVDDPRASFGRMAEVSAGKDSTTGHWELAGIRLDNPFPTYPDGFPDEVIGAFATLAGVDAVLGNVAASGTEIIDRHGSEHLATGHPIVYTSADSVFQVAAHVDVTPLTELYRVCGEARRSILTGEHAVGRVIARPFDGAPGAFRRLSDKRRDYAVEPPEAPVQAILQEAGIRTSSVGKVADLFAGQGFDSINKTSSNGEGIAEIIRLLRETSPEESVFIWANLVDFDQEFGHRNDPAGFARALEEFDAAVDDIIAALPDEAALVITADHGNDPTYPGTDHTREYVPLLLYRGEPGTDLGTRSSFADHAATALAFFGLPQPVFGASFL